MSQEQPQRQQEHEQGRRPEPIKYGDVFQVPGELAKEPIAPGDAALMKSAEASVLGQPIQGGPAAAMQAAAAMNVRRGLVGEDDVSDVTRKQGVTVMETDYPGSRIITEAVGGQVIGQYKQTTAAGDEANITIGEALEASGRTAGDRPIDKSDAAAIQAAECAATGTKTITPGGLAATAQAAAAFNAGLPGDEGKVKLADILAGAPAKMPADKEATREDAEAIMREEVRNDPDLKIHPGGVADAVAAAARVNEGDMSLT